VPADFDRVQGVTALGLPMPPTCYFAAAKKNMAKKNMMAFGYRT
jgi:hypothetical protein